MRCGSLLDLESVGALILDFGTVRNKFLFISHAVCAILLIQLEQAKTELCFLCLFLHI